MNQTAFNLRQAAMAKWASIPAPMRLRIAYFDMLSATYNGLGAAIAQVLLRAGVKVPVLPNGRIDRKHPDVKNFGNILFNSVVRVVKKSDVAEEIIQEKLTEFLGSQFHLLKSKLGGKDFNDAKGYVLKAMINAAYTYGKSESRKMKQEVRLDETNKGEDHPNERQMLQVVEKALDQTQNKGIKRQDWWKHPAWRAIIDDIYRKLIKLDEKNQHKTDSGIVISYLKLFDLVFENGMSTAQAAKKIIKDQADVEVDDWRTVRNRARKVRDKIQTVIDVIVQSLQRSGQLEGFFDLIYD